MEYVEQRRFRNIRHDVFCAKAINTTVVPYHLCFVLAGHEHADPSDFDRKSGFIGQRKKSRNGDAAREKNFADAFDSNMRNKVVLYNEAVATERNDQWVEANVDSEPNVQESLSYL